MFFVLISQIVAATTVKNKVAVLHSKGFTDACSLGFSPKASGVSNQKALQRAVDKGGTVIVSQPGIYNLAGTVYIGSNTSLVFGNGALLKKTNEQGSFTHVILNKGALTRTFDEHIVVDGLNIIVNGIDKQYTEVFGLRGQLAFFYVKDLKVTRFRCLDLMSTQYGIQICTFEDLILDDINIKGDKDGIHLGRGKRFTIRNAVLQTFDDALALNAHDYAASNPELGWIEDGTIENCYDLDAPKTTGFFCRMLAGAWTDWKPGIEVQQADAVVSGGWIYRVQAQPDGKIYKSLTAPTHLSGVKELDGIKWLMVQQDTIHTAGVRNVSFRNIFLYKPRTAFSIHFDNDKYSRSYYPGAQVPEQQQLSFEGVKVLYHRKADFMQISTPVDLLSINNSLLREGGIRFITNKAMGNYYKTTISFLGCSFTQNGAMELLKNDIPNKEINLHTANSNQLGEGFTATINSKGGRINIESDLNGLTTKPVKK